MELECRRRGAESPPPSCSIKAPDRRLQVQSAAFFVLSMTSGLCEKPQTANGQTGPVISKAVEAFWERRELEGSKCVHGGNGGKTPDPSTIPPGPRLE